MTAEILGPRKQRFRMELSPADGLVAGLPPPETFDSALESEVDAVWRKAPVEGWIWQRESQLLVRGQSVMTPDFSLYDQRRDRLIYVEVVGFWTPEYLAEKARRLREFAGDHQADQQPARAVRWLLIVPKELKPEQRSQLDDLGIPIVRFDKKSNPQDWIDAVA